MGEAEPLPVDLEDPGLDRVGQSGLGAAAGGRLDEAHRRVGERGDDPRHLEPAGPRPIDALVHELFQVRGKRQLLARTPPVPPRRCSALASSRAKNGFPADVSQMRMSVGRGRTAPSACSQQLVQRADAERAELDASEPLLRHGPAQPERHLVASGQDRGDRLIVEAGQREPEHRQRRCVEPLDVVDREQQPVVGGELSQGAQEGECDDALLGGRALGLRERERGFERPPLRPRQLRQTRRRRRLRSGRPARRTRTAPPPRRTAGEHPVSALASPPRRPRATASSCRSRPRRRPRRLRASSPGASRRSRRAASSSSLPRR